MRPSKLLMPLRRLQRPPILYAPMPKTASNTLLQRLSACLPCHIVRPKSGGGIGHMILDDHILWQAYRSIPGSKIPLVYGHFMPTDKNRLALMQKLNTGEKPKVIVSTRNIYDVAMSCADHQAEGNGPWWVMRGDNVHLDPAHADEHSHIWNALTCLKFYAAWAIAAKTGAWDVSFVSYDEITDAPDRCVTDVAGFFGYEKDIDSAALTGLAGIRDNMNKGVKGRGTELDPYYRDLLSRFAGCFRDIDFSPLGL